MLFCAKTIKVLKKLDLISKYQVEINVKWYNAFLGM